jgi:hypothetical protein
VNLKEKKNISIKKLTIEIQKRHEDLTKIFQKIYISDEEHSSDEAFVNVAQHVKEVLNTILTTTSASTSVLTTRNVRNLLCLITFIVKLIIEQKDKKRIFNNRRLISTR